MLKAGFFVGCSLFLADNAAAGAILEDLSTGQRAGAADDFAGRTRDVDVEAATFESLFPEYDPAQETAGWTLSERECAEAIGKQVVAGLIFGDLHPEMAGSMLEG
jgi:hypothetical protein